jgi:pilus assembly protein CpaB
MTDVVLEAVPVLGVDQISSENETNPAVGKTATLEVDTFGAQKLALSTQLGVLSLALRNVADQPHGGRATVIPRHLSVNSFYIPGKQKAAVPAQQIASAPALRTIPSNTAPRHFGPMMVIYRGSESSEHEVQRGL